MCNTMINLVFVCLAYNSYFEFVTFLVGVQHYISPKTPHIEVNDNHFCLFYLNVNCTIEECTLDKKCFHFESSVKCKGKQ